MPFEASYGNIEALPYHDNSIDYLLSESVTAFTNLSKSLSEFNRVLKKGGVLIAVEVCQDGSLADKDVKTLKDFYQFRHLLTKGEWQEQLEHHSFGEISLKARPTDLQGDASQTAIPTDRLTVEQEQTLLKHMDLSLEYQFRLHPYLIRCTKQ